MNPVLQTAIEGLRYIRGTTNTGDALKFAREQMFTRGNGDRDNVPNVLVVLTDGGSNDKEKTITEAVATKVAGIHLISMGIGDWTDKYELVAMASYPYDRNYIEVDTFGSLDLFTDRLQDVICNSTSTIIQSSS